MSVPEVIAQERKKLPGASRYVMFPTIAEPRGQLSFMEGESHIPFAIKRVFIIAGVPPDGRRGGHAHRSLGEVIIALTGSLEVSLDDADERAEVRLSRPDKGLYIPPMVWAEEGQFAPGTIVLVLASAPYDESDYVRDYDAFTAMAFQRQEQEKEGRPGCHCPISR